MGDHVREFVIVDSSEAVPFQAQDRDLTQSVVKEQLPAVDAGHSELQDISSTQINVHSNWRCFSCFKFHFVAVSGKEV